jgi:CRP-like cAMP-binding protein
MERRITMLGGNPIFGGLDREAVAFLVERAQTVERSTGALFFAEGDIGDSLHVLELGRVAVVKRRGDVVLKLAELGEGDCFGEMALLAIAPRSAAVRAETPCRAMRISTQVLLDLYRFDLEQFTMVQMNLGREVARRLTLANELLFTHAMAGHSGPGIPGLLEKAGELAK